MIALAKSDQLYTIVGNSTVSADVIRSYIPQQAVDPQAIQKRLMETGFFESVSVERQGNTTVVHVKEYLKLNRVIVEGNSTIPKNALKDILVSKDFGPYRKDLVDEDVKRLREVYKQSGRGFAVVNYRTVPLPNHTVDLLYTVEEGAKTGIKEITFVGNHAFSSRTLRSLMQSTEMNFLSFFKSSDIYNPETVGADLELIRRFYLKNGYADFKIASAVPQFVKGDPSGWKITITVSEGQPYTVGSIQLLSSIDGLDLKPLYDALVLQEGDLYNAEDLQRSLVGLNQAAMQSGYPFAQVRPTGERDQRTHRVNLKLVIEQGPRQYIERIRIRGNTRTRGYVIRRELDLAEGDPYNKLMVDRAKRRLLSLGFFKKVQMTTSPGSSADRIILDIQVEDQPTGSFFVSGGYSTQDGIIGEVSISESNFLGKGQYLRLGLSAGQYAYGFDLSFTEPRFMGQRIATGFDAFYHYNDVSRYARYVTSLYGAQFRIGLPITDQLGVTLRYSAYNTKLSIPNTTKQPYNSCTTPIPGVTPLHPAGTIVNGQDVGGLPIYPDCALNGQASLATKAQQGNTTTSLGGLSLTYSTLDNYFNPTQGFYAEIKPDIAGIGGDSHFMRVVGEARYYHPIYDDIIGFIRFQGGTIKELNDKPLSITDHFFLGPTLVRGFAPYGIGPRDVGTRDGRSNGVGGTNYFGGSAEMQFPIWGIPEEVGVRGAVFADAGTLFGYRGPTKFDINKDGIINGIDSNGKCNFDVASIQVEPECLNLRDKFVIRSSIGASLLWNSPLGPIRFDYAYALTKDNGVVLPGTNIRVGQDVLQAFRFSGGSSF